MPFTAQGLHMCIQLTSALSNHIPHGLTISLFNITAPYQLTSLLFSKQSTTYWQWACSTIQHHIPWRCHVQQHHSDISALQYSITLTSALFNNTAPHFHLNFTETIWWLEYSLQVRRWWRCQSKTKTFTLQESLGKQQGRYWSGWRHNGLQLYRGTGRSRGWSWTKAALPWCLQATCMVCMTTPETADTKHKVQKDSQITDVNIIHTTSKCTYNALLYRLRLLTLFYQLHFHFHLCMLQTHMQRIKRKKSAMGNHKTTIYCS
jgi:hypothetical protein